MNSRTCGVYDSYSLMDLLNEKGECNEFSDDEAGILL